MSHQTPTCLRLRSRSAADTREVGRRLGRLLRPGDLVVLAGELGAGKTTLTQGIAVGLGVADYVTSPTFTLVNEYRPARPGAHLALFHVDLYRTAGAAEALDFGLEEYLGSAGVVVVEWAERAPGALPTERLLMRLEPVETVGAASLGEADEERLIAVCPIGPRYAARWPALVAALGELTSPAVGRGVSGEHAPRD